MNQKNNQREIEKKFSEDNQNIEKIFINPSCLSGERCFQELSQILPVLVFGPRTFLLSSTISLQAFSSASSFTHSEELEKRHLFEKKIPCSQKESTLCDEFQLPKTKISHLDDPQWNLQKIFRYACLFVLGTVGGYGILLASQQNAAAMNIDPRKITGAVGTATKFVGATLEKLDPDKLDKEKQEKREEKKKIHKAVDSVKKVADARSGFSFQGKAGVDLNVQAEHNPLLPPSPFLTGLDGLGNRVHSKFFLEYIQGRGLCLMNESYIKFGFPPVFHGLNGNGGVGLAWSPKFELPEMPSKVKSVIDGKRDISPTTERSAKEYYRAARMRLSETKQCLLVGGRVSVGNPVFYGIKDRSIPAFTIAAAITPTFKIERLTGTVDWSTSMVHANPPEALSKVGAELFVGIRTDVNHPVFTWTNPPLEHKTIDDWLSEK